MDFTKQGIVYVMMVLPIMFTLAVIVHGITKLKQQNKDGNIAIGFGSFLILLIIACYFLFIR